MIIPKRRVSKFSLNFWCKVNHLEIKEDEFGLTLNKCQFINSPLICSSILFFPLFSKERSVPVFFFFFLRNKTMMKKMFRFFQDFWLVHTSWKPINRRQTLCVRASDKIIYGWSMFAALIGLNITISVSPIGYYAMIRPQLRHLRNCFFSMLLKLFSL